jgi:phospholipid/cholesterol/gamma-HCH transport system substrate-binding protein
MGTARIAAGAALVAAVCALAAVVLIGSSSSYAVVADVANAGQLVPGDQVKVGAAVVGSVQDIRLAPNGQAQLVLSIDSGAAPLRQGTTAAIRENSLAGLANRYVVLAPPPGATSSIPSGGQIPITDTTSIVDLDALINAFDPPTRLGLRLLIRGAAQEYAGSGARAARSLQLLAPALYSTDGVARELVRDEPAYASLLRNGAMALGTLASQRQNLTGLVSHANTTMSAIGAQQGSLRRALAVLPVTLRKTEATFGAIRGALPDLQRLVTTAGESSRGLAPFLQRLGSLLSVAHEPVVNLSALVARPGPANDLTDLLVSLPKLVTVAKGAFPRLVATMNRSQNDLGELRDYTPDLTALLTQLDLTSAYYDANGHYARVQPTLAALHYDPMANELQPQAPSARLSGFQLGRTRRCPGGAMQPPPDLSAPFATANCELTSTPPGP